MQKEIIFSRTSFCNLATQQRISVMASIISFPKDLFPFSGAERSIYQKALSSNTSVISFTQKNSSRSISELQLDGGRAINSKKIFTPFLPILCSGLVYSVQNPQIFILTIAWPDPVIYLKQ